MQVIGLLTKVISGDHCPKLSPLQKPRKKENHVYGSVNYSLGPCQLDSPAWVGISTVSTRNDQPLRSDAGSNDKMPTCS